MNIRITVSTSTDGFRYTPKQSTDKPEREACFDTCMLDLKTWYYDLPPDLRIYRGTTTSSARPSAVYILHMLYHTTHILLGKAFLTSSRESSGNPTMNKQKLDTANHGESITKKAGSCVHLAARQVCAIAQMYRKVFGSFRCCATTATHCTLSATLALLQPSSTVGISGKHGLSPTIQTEIDLCLKVLSELSVSWSTADKLRAGLEQLVNSRRKSKKSVKRDDTPDKNCLVDDHKLDEDYRLQTVEPGEELYDFDAMAVENWGDMVQTDSWLFGQEFDVFGTLPSDYQIFDTLSAFTYDQ